MNWKICAKQKKRTNYFSLRKTQLIYGEISRDTFSQNLEDNAMINLQITNKVKGYFKHADGIVTVMGNNITTTEDIHSIVSSPVYVQLSHLK